MALVLILLLVSSFTVFAEELETLTPTSPPPYIPAAVPPHHPYSHSPTPTPTPAPLYPPIHPPHHRYRYHRHHHHPLAPAPVHPPPTPYHYPPTPVHPPGVPVHPPPTSAPANPPTPYHYPPTPVHPPMHPFPISFVAVQGVVFVKSCKYAGVDTLWEATPVLGAIVKLQCSNTKYKVVQTAETDKNGYFFLEASKTITTFGAHMCNVVLVSAPNGLKPSNLNGGVTGAILRPEKPYASQKVPFHLYAVGPLAFEPKCPH